MLSFRSSSRNRVLSARPMAPEPRSRGFNQRVNHTKFHKLHPDRAFPLVALQKIHKFHTSTGPPSQPPTIEARPRPTCENKATNPTQEPFQCSRIRVFSPTPTTFFNQTNPNQPFVIRPSTFLRHSSLGIRHSPLPSPPLAPSTPHGTFSSNTISSPRNIPMEESIFAKIIAKKVPAKIA